MKYVILIVLIVVCVFLCVSLIRNIIGFVKKKKEKSQKIDNTNNDKGGVNE